VELPMRSHPRRKKNRPTPSSSPKLNPCHLALWRQKEPLHYGRGRRRGRFIAPMNPFNFPRKKTFFTFR